MNNEIEDSEWFAVYFLRESVGPPLKAVSEREKHSEPLY